jgi:hypothetical protein
MNLSTVRRETWETVSIDLLHEKLPEKCYQAVLESTQLSSGICLDDGIQRAYFTAEPTPVLTEEEQQELFEQLGNEWVKNHYSTAELRALLDKPSIGKKIRRDE